MPKVRGDANKWQQRAINATGDYSYGVQNPRSRWDDATVAAAQQYEQGIQASIQAKSFQKGVKASGHEYWQAKTMQVGPGRYSEGVRNGAENYTAGFEPYKKVIENTNLPARGARGSDANYQRSMAMGKALADARRKIKSGV